MGRRYLVTGGTGFIGAAVARMLATAGHEVRVLDNNSRGRNRRLGDLADAIEMVEGDIRDADAVSKAVKGVDSVLHLAFINGTEFFYQYPELILDVGVRGMLNVLDACRAHEVSELVLASSSEVYQQPPVTPTPENVPLVVPDPLNSRYSYGGGKLISELMTLNWGRNGFERVMIFRPHNVYGPDMGWEHVIPQFAERIIEQGAAPGATLPFRIKGSGEQTRSFVFIDDFVAGVGCMLDRGEHLNIYHIGTLEELTIKELAQEVGKAFDVKLDLSTEAAPIGETVRRCPDISKIQALGYAPEISLCDGLARTIPWYRENFGARGDRFKAA